MLGRPGWPQRCSWKPSSRRFPLATLFDASTGHVFSYRGLQPQTKNRSSSSAIVDSPLCSSNERGLSRRDPFQGHNGDSNDIENLQQRISLSSPLSPANYPNKPPSEAVTNESAPPKRKSQTSRRSIRSTSGCLHNKRPIILNRRAWEDWSIRPNESKIRTIERVRAIRNKIASRVKRQVWELPEWHIKPHDPHEIVLYGRSRGSRLASRTPIVKLEKFYKGWTNALNRLHHYHLLQGPNLNDDKRTWRMEFKHAVNKRLTLKQMSSSPDEVPVTNNRSYVLSRITRRYWMSALLWALSNRPEFVHPILEVVNSRAFTIPSYIALDCVTFCLRRLLPEPDEKASSKAIRYCFRLVMYYLDKYYAENGVVQVNGRLTRLLSSHLDAEMLDELQHRICKYAVCLTPYDIRNFAYRSLADSQAGKVLEWIGRLSPEELNSDETLTLCTVLLRSTWDLENPYEVRTNILYALLEIGVRPNAILRDVIVLNAMEGGDRHSAWSSYRVMLENGLAPSAFTYAILLKGAVLGDGTEVISSIHREVQENGLLYRNPVLATALLQATHGCESLQGTISPFNKCLEIYCQLFDLRPLHDILIVEGARQSNPPGTEVMRPTNAILGIMITAWLRENNNPAKLDRAFKLYLRRVRERKSRLAITGHYTYVFQSFIKAFTEQGNSLKRCVSIVRGMEDPKLWDERRSSPMAYAHSDLESDLVSSLGDEPRTITVYPPLTREKLNPRNYHVKVPTPDVRIWTSLLHAYMRHGQAYGAEKILEIMDSRNITPDSMTWNHLIHGYAALNNVEGVMDALRRRINAKMQPDDWTLKALGRTPNREALREALKMVESKNASVAQDEPSWERMNQVLEEQFS